MLHPILVGIRYRKEPQVRLMNRKVQKLQCTVVLDDGGI